MKLAPLAIPGAFRVELELFADERGHFARTYSADLWRAHGLDPHIEQTSLSFNAVRGTLRGLHWQTEPFGETKIVRCVRGRIWDVVADVRPDSSTYGEWTAVELDPTLGAALVLPPGVAHGFLTLTDACEVHYAMSVAYQPEAARGARWDDPLLGIAWPEPIVRISERDRQWPALSPRPAG